MAWQYFLLEPTDRARFYLRRYSREHGTDLCPRNPGEYSYHNAQTYIGDFPVRRDERGFVVDPPIAEWPAGASTADPRWPPTCDCGTTWQPDDHRQLFNELIYVRQDTGEEVTLRDPPIGAMWDAFWSRHRGPDGLSLVVQTPGGEWMIDGPSSSGGHWFRTGQPPRITVTPSIAAGHPERYHGFLTDGQLTDDLAGRQYPRVEQRKPRTPAEERAELVCLRAELAAGRTA
jgi:hypothetical protein